MQEMVSYLLGIPEYYCSHSFRILYYANLIAIAGVIPLQTQVSSGQVKQTPEDIGFVWRPNCDDDFFIAENTIDTQGGDNPRTVGAAEKASASSLIWTTQRLDYECRGAELADWPLYFYISAVSRIKKDVSPANNIFLYDSAHPCAAFWKQVVRTTKAWCVPELVGPKIPSVSQDPENEQ